MTYQPTIQDASRGINVLRKLLTLMRMETPEQMAERLLAEGADIADIIAEFGMDIDELIIELEGCKESLVHLFPGLADRFRVGMPEVVVQVNNGKAEVTAANRQVHVHVIDLEQPTSGDAEDLEAAIEGQTFDGRPIDILTAMDAARAVWDGNMEQDTQNSAI